MENTTENTHFISEQEYKKNTKGISISTNESIIKRIYLLISNPFRYIIFGKIKY
jgi:hypothetical protein